MAIANQAFMTKSELIEILTQRQGHLKSEDVDLAVKSLLEMMGGALAQGQHRAHHQHETTREHSQQQGEEDADAQRGMQRRHAQVERHGLGIERADDDADGQAQQGDQPSDQTHVRLRVRLVA